MSLTILVWLGLFFGMSALAFYRPAWGVAAYMLSVFLCPPFWWWGDAIAHYRWNFYSGWVLLAAVLVSGWSSQRNDPVHSRRIRWLTVAGLVNATFVHLFLADSPQISSGVYIDLAKFSLLFLLIAAAIRDKTDYRIVVWSILLGAAYIGYEVTINDRGSLSGNRLEGIGMPCAAESNGLASLMVTVLPLTGPILLTGRWWEKLLVLPIGPFIVNVLLLCNSRGAFLAAIATGVAFLSAAPSGARRKALKVVTLGCVAVWLLLGDPRIVERFLSTFVDAGERDASAESRLGYWEAGLRMIADYPLGAGGDGFHSVHGMRYIADVTGVHHLARSVHNGFINTACDWGVQGLALKMAFFCSCLILLWQTMHATRAAGDDYATLLGAGLFAGLVGFLVTAMFGDYMDNEWGFWIPALVIGHARLYATNRQARQRSSEGHRVFAVASHGPGSILSMNHSERTRLSLGRDHADGAVEVPNAEA